MVSGLVKIISIIASPDGTDGTVHLCEVKDFT